MKPLTRIAAVVFTLMAIIHVGRLFASWEIVVNGFAVPIWISVPGFVITGFLAAMLWRENLR